MYKYFKELENPNDFYIYLKKIDYINKNEYYIKNIPLDGINIDKVLIKELEFIRMLILGMNKKISKYNMTYEEYMRFYDFFTLRDENANYYLDNHSLNLNTTDLRHILQMYSILSNPLIDFFPEYKERISKIKQDILKIIKQIEEKSTIIIEKKAELKYILPNAWFITPYGYLYNTGGENGHKEGNLIYPFHNLIKQALYNNKLVPETNTLEKINSILKRGYVTQLEFDYYAHLIYRVPTIKTPEVELEEEKYKKILEMDEEEFLKIDYENLPCPERSYQKILLIW
ncbi:MAG TPA: hypothetical protein PLV83_04810 [Bacilli bacterium]|nr:hypothetical protein [Bacilli bacterium]